MIWRVLIPDAVDTVCDRLLEEGGCEVVRMEKPSDNALLEVVADFDAMVVRSAVTVTAEMIDRMERMKVIGRAGAGVDNIDTAAATRSGILVMNTPGGNTVSAAEHTIALLLALLRNIPEADASMKRGAWDRKKFTGAELYGKTVGVVGLGKIGREVLERLLPFEIEALGYDPVLGDDGIRSLGAEPVSFEDLVARADVITFHVPLNEKTRGMVGDDEIARMKEGVRLVNCARGGVVDEEALLAGLESGRVAGAALDVYTEEPPTDERLASHPNVVATPHIAASTSEAQHRVAVAIAEGILGFRRGEEITGLVNAGDVGSAFSRVNEAPYRLALTMGHLLEALGVSRDESLAISVYNGGEPTGRSGLVATLLTGLFSRHPGGVSPINAGVIAGERNVEATVVRELDESRHTSFVRVVVDNGGEVDSIALALSSAGEPRIVEVNGRELDFAPYGHVLLLEHIDRPGMIAAISTIMAMEKINIADLSLGRRDQGSALTLIRTDQPIPEEVVEEIGGLEGISRARFFSVNGPEE